MIEQDTIKLLRECDAGVKMGVSSIEDVLDYAHDEKLRTYLSDNKSAHEKLDIELQELLDRYQDDGKDPNPIAKGMSWMKTNVMLVMKESDTTIAALITDGFFLYTSKIAHNYSTLKYTARYLDTLLNICYCLPREYA